MRRIKSDLQKKKDAARAKEWRKDNLELVMWYNAKHRAKKKGLVFTLEVSDIHIPSHCPALGIELQAGGDATTGRRTDNSPSLDRIDPTVGYTKNNIIVVSHKANAIKYTATPTELKQVADFYCKISGL